MRNSGISIPVPDPNESLPVGSKIEINNLAESRLRVRERDGVIIFDRETIVDISGRSRPI